MTERTGLRVARTIGIAVVSLLLIVGGAFAANGLANSSAPNGGAPVSIEAGSTESPEATEDSNESEGDDDLDVAAESPDATDDQDDGPTASPEASHDDGDDHDEDAAASPEPTHGDEHGDDDSPESSDDHDDHDDDD